jgi:APA family basic amino acid/polyamine antiporter
LIGVIETKKRARKRLIALVLPRERAFWEVQPARSSKNICGPRERKADSGEVPEIAAEEPASAHSVAWRDMSGNPREPSLLRQIGLFSAVAVLVGSTIGSGIFRSPADIAKAVPGPLPILLVWLVGGLFALCGALTLAELGGAFPRTGGLYVFILEGFGRLPAFLFGWIQLTVVRAAALGAVSITFGEYALRAAGWQQSDPGFDRGATYLAIAAMAALAVANFFGVRWGTGIQNLTTVIKVGGLLVLIALAFAIGLPHTGGHYAPPIPENSFRFSAFGLAIISVLWAYDGWADVTYVGGEVADGRKNVPRAVLIGTLTVIGVYVIANIAYLAVLSPAEIAGQNQVAATVMERLVGPWGPLFIGIVVMVSTFGTLNGSLLTTPRIFYAIAHDRLFFHVFSKVHAKYHTPYAAILLSALLGIGFVSIGTFEDLADAMVTALVPFYGLAVAAVFSVRRRHGYDPPVRTPLYPIVPALFILSTLLLLGNALWDEMAMFGETRRLPTAMVLGWILVRIPVYFLTVGRRQRKAHS